jgi:hypothetical protein
LSGSLTPTTELDAVNDMLSAIGETPVATLEGELQPDAQLAYRLLLMQSRTIQAKGWHWNTERSLTILPNVSGEFPLPANTLSVDTVEGSATLDLINRDGKLYDTRNATWVVEADEVKVDLVTLLDYEVLPQIARDYIRIRAGRIFLQRTIGASDSIGYEARDEQEALAVIEGEEEANADRSIFDNPHYARLLQNRRPIVWP